jgi:hypothetical protein
MPGVATPPHRLRHEQQAVWQWLPFSVLEHVDVPVHDEVFALPFVDLLPLALHVAS